MLNNKNILITGSTTGIGAAIARECIEAGARVMIHGRNEQRAQQFCQQLGKNAAYVIADLADENAAQLLVDSCVETFGSIDGLVNNAGVYPRSTIDSSSADLFDQVMAVNLKAPLLLIKAAIQHFRQQQSKGSIVNIGSINAHCGQPDLLIYSMSKGGLMTLTRNLADALAHEGIRVNQLNVGWTATENEIALKQNEGLPLNWQALIPRAYAPQGKILDPAHIAPHVVFWLSEQSAPCNGAVYEIEQYPIIGRNRISDIEL